MLTVSLCRITLPQTLQANFSNKRILPIPLSREHILPGTCPHTRGVSDRAVTGHACSAPEGQPAAHSAAFLLCHFTQSCSHPRVRFSSASEGSKFTITHISSASREGVLKIQKEPASRLYLCSTWHRTKTSTQLLACKTSQQRCLHCFTELALPLHQFLKLTSSQQTQLKDTTSPWKETGDQLWYVEIIWVGRQCVALEGDDPKKLTSHIWISTGHFYNIYISAYSSAK